MAVTQKTNWRKKFKKNLKNAFYVKNQNSRFKKFSQNNSNYFTQSRYKKKYYNKDKRLLITKKTKLKNKRLNNKKNKFFLLKKNYKKSFLLFDKKTAKDKLQQFIFLKKLIKVVIKTFRKRNNILNFKYVKSDKYKKLNFKVLKIYPFDILLESFQTHNLVKAVSSWKKKLLFKKKNAQKSIKKSFLKKRYTQIKKSTDKKKIFKFIYKFKRSIYWPTWWKFEKKFMRKKWKKINKFIIKRKKRLKWKKKYIKHINNNINKQSIIKTHKLVILKSIHAKEKLFKKLKKRQHFGLYATTIFYFKNFSRWIDNWEIKTKVLKTKFFRQIYIKSFFLENMGFLLTRFVEIIRLLNEIINITNTKIDKTTTFMYQEHIYGLLQQHVILLNIFDGDLFEGLGLNKNMYQQDTFIFF